MQGIKLTIEEVRKTLKKRNIKLLSKSYKNSRTNIKVKCIICKHKWYAVYDNLKRNNCPECTKKRLGLGRRISKKTWKRRFFKKGFITIQHLNGYWEVECRKCNHTYETTTHNTLVQNRGCPECARLRQVLTQEEAAKKLLKRGYILLNEYISARDKVRVKCKDCNYKFTYNYNDLAFGRPPRVK